MMNIDVEHGTIEKVLPDFEVKKTSFRFGFPKNSQKIFKCRNSKCFTTANIFFPHKKVAPNFLKILQFFSAGRMAEA